MPSTSSIRLNPPYGCSALKETIAADGGHRFCPVKDCNTTVPVRHQGDPPLRSEQFHCPEHDLYISQTVFYYGGLEQAVFYPSDLESRMEGKRETDRIRSCISEDALTWNVFRPLQDSLNAPALLQDLFELPSAFDEFDLFFWGNHKSSQWSPLNDARQSFGERLERSTEPDLMILAGDNLVLIESKLTAPNSTGGWKNRSDLEERESRYQRSGDNWWNQVFSPGTDFQLVADEERFYELARMWLIGSWIADRLDLQFTLVSLTLPDKETDRVDQFRRHLSVDDTRRFAHHTWRDVLSAYNRINDDSLGMPARFLRDLQLGYTGSGKLVRAGL